MLWHSAPQTTATAAKLTGNGHPSHVTHTQPTYAPIMYTDPCAKLIRFATPKINASPTAVSAYTLPIASPLIV